MASTRGASVNLSVFLHAWAFVCGTGARVTLQMKENGGKGNWGLQKTRRGGWRIDSHFRSTAEDGGWQHGRVRRGTQQVECTSVTFCSSRLAILQRNRRGARGTGGLRSGERVGVGSLKGLMIPTISKLHRYIVSIGKSLKIPTSKSLPLPWIFFFFILRHIHSFMETLKKPSPLFLKHG